MLNYGVATKLLITKTYNDKPLIQDVKSPCSFFSELFPLTSNNDITFFLDASRDVNGIFNLYSQGSYKLMVTDQYFALLKLAEPDEDLDLDCLAGHLNSSSTYIKVYPVDCQSRVANSYICRMPYYECAENPQGIRQQLDLLFDPVFREDQIVYVTENKTRCPF